MSAESGTSVAMDAVPADTRRRTAALAGPLGLAAVVYGLLLIVGERLLNDPDTYWHIATGRWIWAHAAVPTTDPFSHTLPGAPWLAHEWLSELILAGAYGALGWAGVVALAALATAASLALLLRALERFVRPTVALGATAMAFFLMAAHVTARPHALALPILVAWAAALVRARDESRAPSLWFLPLMVLWANLHGGFVVGLGLAGVLAVEAVMTARDGSERRAAALGWGRFVVGAALASLLTPQGIAGWWFPFKLMSLGFSLSFVGEWHAPALALFEPLVLWLMALLVFALGTGLRVPLFRVLMVAGLVAMALSHTRNAELLAMLAPLLVAASLRCAQTEASPLTQLRLSSLSLAKPPQPSSDDPLCGSPFGSRVAARPDDPQRGEGRVRGPLNLHVVLPAFIIAVTAAASLHGYAHDNPAIAPAPALAAARQAGLTGPVLNDYDFGGYLIFEGVAPFVDGRIDLYGDDFMRAYAAGLGAEDDALPTLLERYHIAWTLLKPGENAVGALDRDPGWERVYADSSAVVHRRR